MRFLEAIGILLAAFSVLFVLRLALEFWLRGVERDARLLIDGDASRCGLSDEDCFGGPLADCPRGLCLIHHTACCRKSHR